MSDPGMQEAMQAMMADPAMQQLMQQQMSAMLATPEGQAQMQAMLEQNPMYQRWGAPFRACWACWAALNEGELGTLSGSTSPDATPADQPSYLTSALAVVPARPATKAAPAPAPVCARSAVAANPQLADQMRAMLTDPQRLRAMMDPRAQHAMQQMMQVQGGGRAVELKRQGWGGAKGAGSASLLRA